MTSPETLNSILSLLSGALDAKKDAQQALQSNAFDPGEFMMALLNLCLNSNLSEAIRQLAALTLRNYVEWHWSAKGDKFIGPEEISTQTKEVVRAQITYGLKDSSSKSRIAIAYVISKIAHFDWPEVWPTLFDELMSCLNSKHADAVHGATRVLVEFVREVVSDEQVPIVAPVLFPQLLQIFSNEVCMIITKYWRIQFRLDHGRLRYLEIL